MNQGAQFIRREIAIRLVRAFDSGTLTKEIDEIPVKLRPKNEASSRCCVYHDRAVIKYRLMALLGYSIEDETDEAKTLGSYFADVVREVGEGRDPYAGQAHRLAPLSVCDPACSGCPDSRVMVTDNCRGCFARPCMYNCPRKAVSVVGGRSVIDQSACVKCGRCITVCPYHAIIKTTVPCEDACPVNAIKKDENGIARIDFKKCIYCGKCFSACPFGAVMERSQLVEVLLAMKSGRKVVAMIAPAAAHEFPGRIEQLMTACLKAGFSDVMEVALGAELTTRNETKEFIERMEKDPKSLMTTSCCPAWVNLAAKHVPEALPHVSSTPSPMVYANDIVKKKDPDAMTVFIGPCIAKRSEARRKDVDFVLSFEELGAIFAARNINTFSCEPHNIERPAEATARNYCRSCGVTEAVLAEATSKIEGFRLDAKQISGIDRKTVNLVKLYVAGKMPGNFLEVMACPGGCEHGPCSLK